MTKRARSRPTLGPVAERRLAGETSFDTFARLGLIGCIEGDATDLSTDASRKVREILLGRGARRARTRGSRA